LKDREIKDSFIKLIEKNQGIIFKVSKMYCDNDIDQEDLFQDILIQLWNAYPSFKGHSKFSTWMYRVALNTAISRIRKGKVLDNEELTSDFKFDVSDGETENDLEERSKLLHRAISKLNKAEKAIIMLYMDDYSYEEISEIAGISVSNVGVKIVRIKKKLQMFLNALGYGK